MSLFWRVCLSFPSSEVYLGIILEPVKPLHSGFNFRVVWGKGIVDFFRLPNFFRFAKYNITEFWKTLLKKHRVNLPNKITSVWCTLSFTKLILYVYSTSLLVLEFFSLASAQLHHPFPWSFKTPLLIKKKLNQMLFKASYLVLGK